MYFTFGYSCNFPPGNFYHFRGDLALLYVFYMGLRKNSASSFRL
jgi:hypothetical protein